MTKVTVNIARLVQLQDLLKQARKSYTTKVSLLNDVIEEIDNILLDTTTITS